MTQEQLKMWLESNDCYVYKSKPKEDGTYYFMRRNNHDGKLAVLFPPKRGFYKQENVCHICNLLDVLVPDYGQGVQGKLDAVKKDLHEKRS